MIEKKNSQDSGNNSSSNSPHGPFLVLLILFAGFSLYAFASFFNSANLYLDRAYTSVIAVDEAETPQLYKNIFTDVYVDNPNAVAIEALYNEGIIKGYDDGSFKPGSTINRAELLTIITSAANADFGGKKLENCFKDVQSQWFAAFICYAKDGQWVKGFDDGSYRPNLNVTKAEALKITMEALQYPSCATVDVPPYDDVAVDAWYAPYVCSAKKSSIIVDESAFNPKSAITRGEFIGIIYKVMVGKGIL